MGGLNLKMTMLAREMYKSKHRIQFVAAGSMKTKNQNPSEEGAGEREAVIPATANVMAPQEF